LIKFRQSSSSTLLSNSNAAPGNDSVYRSLELAKRRDAKAWELRTATTLALLYLRLGRTHEARAELEPTINQFKQERDTRDFQAAISVLSALSG
jgi:hypothetical protein